MHQLIGRRRPGLPAQSAQLCTTCLVVLSRPLQSAALSSAASTAHYTTSAPRWMRAASLRTACPALQWRQLRKYTTPTRPMFRPVEGADAVDTEAAKEAKETKTTKQKKEEAKKEKKASETKEGQESKEAKEFKKKKAKKEKAEAADTGDDTAKDTAKDKAKDTVDGNNKTTRGGEAKQPRSKVKRQPADSKAPATSRKAARAAMFKTSATAVAAAALLKSGMYQKQVQLWTEALNVLNRLEASQEKAAVKAATAAETAKAYEAANAKLAAEIAGSGQSQAVAGGAEGADGETASTDTAVAAKKKKKASKKISAKAETLAAHAAADANAAQAAAAAAKDAQTQVKLLTNALHTLKQALSLPESEKTSPESAPPPTRAPPSRLPAKMAYIPSPLGIPAKPQYKPQPGIVDAIIRSQAKGLTDNNSIMHSSKANANANASANTKTNTTAGNTSEVKDSPEKSEKVDVKAKKGEKDGKGGTAGLNSSRYQVSKINTKELQLTPIEENMRDVPQLSYGLDRALFNPGVYHLQDPHSRVYNFDPYLASIMPLREFDFNALKQYVTSSKDPMLIHMAHKHKMRYSGSTSSMTSMLSHFHFLLSSWRPVNPAQVSRNFQPESYNYTRITRAPAAIFLHWKPEADSYAIDADKQFDSANILSMLGKSMEKLLTLSKEDYEKYRVTRSHELTDAERNDPEAFHYTTFGDFMMRSQLDAYDNRLPGTGMFDLKTRAVVSIRMDAQHFQQGLGYEIRSRFGQFESFEREYYDMIRSAFLKYSLQVRMGRMDGIYVAFHNTERIFGFQYISINEMDLALHGNEDRTLGDREFMVSLKMLNDVLDRATKKFPNQSLRMHFETRPSASAPFMYVFAEPVTPEAIEEVQSSNKAEVEEFERNMMGLSKNEAGDALVEAARQAAIDMADEVEAEAEAETLLEDEEEARAQFEEELARQEEEENDEDELDSLSVWESMRQRVEETMENEALGIESVRDTIEDALEQSGLLTGRSAEETREYVEALLGAVIATDTKAAAETIYKDAKGEEATEVDAEVDAEVEAEVEADAEAEIEVEPKAADQEAEVAETVSSEIEEPSESEAGNIVEAAEATEATETIEATEATEDTELTEATEASETTETEPAEVQGETAEAEHPVEDDIVIEESTASGTSDIGKGESTSAESDESALLPSDNISLKDLIMKLAAQVEAAQTRDASATAAAAASKSPSATLSPTDEESSESADFSSPDDAPKNKRFERILSELLAKSSPKTAKKAEAEAEAAKAAAAARKTESPLMGMIVTIRNKVNGKYMARPEKLSKLDTWTVEYAVEEIQENRAHGLYSMLQKRRKNLMTKMPDFKDEGETSATKNKKSSFNRDYMARLYKLSAKGRQIRHKENLEAQSRPLHVYGMDSSLKWTDVFQPIEEEQNEDRKKKKKKQSQEPKTTE